MDSKTTPWAGWGLISIGVIHNIFGLVIGWTPLTDGITAGLINVWDDPPARGFVYWFLAFGVLCWVAGAAVAQIERAGLAPSWLLIILLGLLGVSGVITSPASGFWLILIPWGLLITHRVERARSAKED